MVDNNELITRARDRGYKDGYEGRPPTPGHGYTDQRTEAYIDGHRLGRLAGQANLDISWITDDDTAVGVVKVADHYLVVERGDLSNRVCVISYSKEGRMLFDGEDIETEDFMALVGMLDAVNDSPHKRVLFNADMTVVDL